MIETNGIPIIEKGSGKPLILLHGFLCSKEYFATQINFFSRYRKVVAYDLYGFGKNVAKGPYTLQDYANEFCVVAKNYGEKVDVIAHSFGCRVVLKSALSCNLIDRAVICGVAGLKPAFSIKREIKKRAYKVCKPFMKREKAEKRFFSSDYNALSSVMKVTFKQVVSEYLDDSLPKINIPTLAVFGENDKETPPKIANKLIAKMPNCEKYIMNGCGHFCYAERPNEFNHVVKEFLL